MVKVSVIIPVYKVKKDYFRECLESVMNQSLKEIEIILVDDCGGDGAIEFAKEVTKQDSRVKFVYNEINRGAGQSRNEGIRAATGEFVGMLMTLLIRIFTDIYIIVRNIMIVTL